jgi:hypothetical protein
MTEVEDQVEVEDDIEVDEVVDLEAHLKEVDLEVETEEAHLLLNFKEEVRGKK